MLDYKDSSKLLNDIASFSESVSYVLKSTLVGGNIYVEISWPLSAVVEDIVATVTALVISHSGNTIMLDLCKRAIMSYATASNQYDVGQAIIDTLEEKEEESEEPCVSPSQTLKQRTEQQT